jgi:PPK2 family polyphosphate:nucleotide phosphotransferase
MSKQDDTDHHHRPTHGSGSALSALLRARPELDIAALDPSATPGFPGRDKSDATQAMADLADELSDWQEKLFAQSKDPDFPSRAVLVVLQGLDTAGKGGVIRHVFGMMDPQGLKLHAFKQPTKEELAHDFLWRVRRQLPERGMVGIFDRSHYEDVLVARVDQLVPEEVWQARFEVINQFEAEVVASGTRLIKCFLHISADEQQQRLVERLGNPAKHWKYSPTDVATRRHWDDYQLAYQDVLNRCNTEIAPWYIIPSDRKWYRNWAVAGLLLEQLRLMSPVWPSMEFDASEQLALLSASLR